MLQNVCIRDEEGLFIGEPIQSVTDSGKLIYVSEM